VAALNFENLLKTIDRFGPEGVLDAAREAGLPLEQLVRLQEAIDKLPRQPRRRSSAEARVRTWLGLPATEEDVA